MSAAEVLDTCAVCEEYFARRMNVLPRATADIARSRGISAKALAERYVASIHERHEAGLPLSGGTPVPMPRSATAELAGRFAALMAIVNEAEAGDQAC